MPCCQVAVYRCLIDIAAGMDYLHSIGIMHGDLKAANVLCKSTATDPRGFTCKVRCCMACMVFMSGRMCAAAGPSAGARLISYAAAAMPDRSCSTATCSHAAAVDRAVLLAVG